MFIINVNAIEGMASKQLITYSNYSDIDVEPFQTKTIWYSIMAAITMAIGIAALSFDFVISNDRSFDYDRPIGVCAGIVPASTVSTSNNCSPVKVAIFVPTDVAHPVCHVPGIAVVSAQGPRSPDVVQNIYSRV